MPSESWAKNERGVEKANRRASLPHNLKIPVIIFTPPSPSPDINDPDYPEFFQDRPYLESKVNCMSTSVECDDDVTTKMVTETSAASTSLESSKDMGSTGFGLSTASCQNDDVYLRLRSKSFTSTVSLSDEEEEEDYDMVQSTPEFDEILSNARTEREILNCLKFKEENKL